MKAATGVKSGRRRAVIPAAANGRETEVSSIETVAASSFTEPLAALVSEPEIAVLSEGVDVVAQFSAITDQLQPGVESTTLEAELASATNTELHQRGLTAVAGFKQSRLLLAMILIEVWNRTANNGKAGRPRAGAPTFSGFCAAVNFSVKTAQGLLRNFKLVNTFNPELVALAKREGIDVLKPKVVAEFERIEQELWDREEVSDQLRQEFLFRLAAAEERAPNARPIKVASEEQGDPHDGMAKPNARHKPGGPRPFCLNMKSHELRKLTDGLAKLRTFPGYSEAEITTEEVLLLLIEKVVAELEVQREDATSWI